MLGCLSLRRCLISVSLMSRTFFTATSSPWNLPRKTAPCAPLPTHCKSEISSKGTSQDSGCTAAAAAARDKATELMWIKCFFVLFFSQRTWTLSQVCAHQGEIFKIHRSRNVNDLFRLLQPTGVGRVCWANVGFMLHIKPSWQDAIRANRATVVFEQMAILTTESGDHNIPVQR